MKKFLLLIFTLCFIASLLLICGTAGGESAPKASNAQKNQKVINIGVFEPLTGDDAIEGQQEALGIRYANSICPTVDIDGVTYSIKLFEQDNASDINSASASAQALAQNGLTAVLGSYGSWLTSEGNKIFAKDDIPFVGISASSQLLTKDVRNYYRVCYSDAFQSGALASFGYSINCRKAAVLTQTGDVFSKNTGRLISEEFSRLGGSSVSFDFQNNQQNFRSLIDTIKSSGVDCVFMDSGPEEAVYFIKQARETGLNCTIIGPEAWDSSILLNNIADSFGDVYLSSEFDSSDSKSSEFAAQYSSWLRSDKSRIEENGGSDYVSPSSALAYDSYMLLVDAVKTAKSSDSKAVLDTLKTIKYKGISGDISFEKNGDSCKNLAYIKKISTEEKCFVVQQTSSVGK